MSKERINKFFNSLAFGMAMPMTYVPVFTFVHQLHDSGFGMVILGCLLGFTILGFLVSYLLYVLVGDVGFKEVDQDRRLRGVFSLWAFSMLLMVPYMYFFEEAEPVIRWSAWIVMVIILFIAAYSICKQYIMKNKLI